MKKIAYFDCFCGAAGDMIVGACLDAGVSEKMLRNELAKLHLHNVDITIEKINKAGIASTQFTPVIHKEADAHHHHHHPHEYPHEHSHHHDHPHTHPDPHDHHHDHPHDHKHDHKHEHDHSDQKPHHHHHHRNLSDITAIIKNANYAPAVEQNALAIFNKLAEAEAHVHGTTVDKIHFHEVGAEDAIMDIVAACIALDSLNLDEIQCSYLTVGGGTVKCDHGIMPVPAPATAELIKGIPINPTPYQMELLTPTGAAILTTLASGFGPIPAMAIESTGYGAGQRDLEGTANVLRLVIGTECKKAANPPTASNNNNRDEVVILEANIDDTTPEVIGYLTEKLFAAGALDVYTSPIAMKKNRPGIILTALAKPGENETLAKIIFRESTTFGIREKTCQRWTLKRNHQTVETPYGPIRIKLGYFGNELMTVSPEFEDCKIAADKHSAALKDVFAAARSAWQQS